MSVSPHMLLDNPPQLMLIIETKHFTQYSYILHTSDVHTVATCTSSSLFRLSCFSKFSISNKRVVIMNGGKVVELYGGWTIEISISDLCCGVLLCYYYA